jgi:hypothetical protein
MGPLGARMLGSAGVLAAMCIAVAPPLPAAARTLARFSWSVSGSFRHDWSVSSSEPCAPVGSGAVTANFSGRGHGAFVVGSNRFGAFYNYDPTVKVRGSITARDDRVLNPPEPNGVCTPIDKSGCGTFRLRSFAAVSVNAPATRRSRWTATGDNFGNVLLEQPRPCEHGFFSDYTFLNARSRPLHPRLPGTAASFARRRSFSVSLADRRSDSDGPISSHTLRQLTLRFRRIR